MSHPPMQLRRPSGSVVSSAKSSNRSVIQSPFSTTTNPQSCLPKMVIIMRVLNILTFVITSFISQFPMVQFVCFIVLLIAWLLIPLLKLFLLLRLNILLPNLDFVPFEGECWSQTVSIFSSLPNHVHFRSFVVHSTSVDSDHSLLR